MTSTDRAFIAALQKANATSSALVGPHYASTATTATHVANKPAGVSKKSAPLSAHMARRRTPVEHPVQQPTAVPTILASNGPFAAALEVDVLSWPAVAQQLAHAGREGLVELLTSLAHRRPEATPQVSVVGVRPGVGATTLLLALARVVGSIGGSTAIIDLAGKTGAAAQLGVRGQVSDAQRSLTAIADDLCVYSREDQLSVVALGRNVASDVFASVAARLAATHELVLIDMGVSTAARLGAGVQIVLADATPSDHSAVGAAQAELTAIDIAGVVETFTPLA